MFIALAPGTPNHVVDRGLGGPGKPGLNFINVLCTAFTCVDPK